MGELVQVLGFVKVFQHEPAPLDQGRAEWQGIFEQPGRRGGHQDLAPVGGGGDAGGLVHGQGQVTAVGAGCGHPGVQPHAHPDDGVVGPGVGGQGPLGVDARRRRPGRVGEHDQAPSPPGLASAPPWAATASRTTRRWSSSRRGKRAPSAGTGGWSPPRRGKGTSRCPTAALRAALGPGGVISRSKAGSWARMAASNDRVPWLGSSPSSSPSTVRSRW